MPFRRRRFSGRFGRRRFPWMSRRRASRSRFGRFTGRRSRPTVSNRVRPYPEVKKTTTAVVDATIDVAGVISTLFDPSSGAGLESVAGMRCRVKYIYWRCQVGAPNTLTNTPSIRIILFVDRKGTSASLPTVAGDNDTAVLQDATVTAPLSYYSAGRYTILSDRVFTFNPGANVADAAGTGVPIQQNRFYKVFRRLNFDWTTDLSTQEPSQNRIFCLYLTDLDEIGSINAVCRIGYTDS